MSLTRQELTKDSTIYNYMLLSRIRNAQWMPPLYWGIFGGALLVCWLFGEHTGHAIYWLIGGLPGSLYLYYAVTKSYLHFTGAHSSQSWKTSFSCPWIGFLPHQQFVSYRILLHSQLHIFGIALCTLMLLLSWSGPWDAAALLFVHLWLLMPRFAILLWFRRSAPSGWLRITKTETSYYKQ
ncbi:hypothetical protein [Paenibacillus sp. y28]|uniref:hypothetical protein n=1 Tax=Paenibacillus sp. y28 TaxID=3129110 RepID=UPI00301822AB